MQGKSDVNHFIVGAQACLPIINAILADVRMNTYLRKSFLNINLPADIANNKVAILFNSFCTSFLFFHNIHNVSAYWSPLLDTYIMTLLNTRSYNLPFSYKKHIQ